MLVIGIEGLVGAGKTSICRNLINKVSNTILLNGGNLYRTVIASIMQKGNELKNLIENAKSIDIKNMMDLLNIEIRIENGETCFYVDGKKADENLIQSKEISMAVSSIGGKAKEESLYKFAKELIDNLKKRYNVIISGRDLMRIYPDCDYHIFVTADLETRVSRKSFQYKNDDIETVRKNIIERDKLQKEAGYYDLYDITKVVDVSECKNVEESTEKVLDALDLDGLIEVAN